MIPNFFLFKTDNISIYHSMFSIEKIEHFLYVEDLEILVYLSFILALIIFCYGIYRWYKRWTYGGYKIKIDNLPVRIGRFIKYGLLQARVVRKPFEGIIHVFIYIGFIVLFIGTILRALEADITLRLFGYRILTSNAYLIFKLLMNISGILAIIGILLAFIRRLFFKSKYLPDTFEDYTILSVLLIILITGFIPSSDGEVFGFQIPDVESVSPNVDAV